VTKFCSMRSPPDETTTTAGHGGGAERGGEQRREQKHFTVQFTRLIWPHVWPARVCPPDVGLSPGSWVMQNLEVSTSPTNTPRHMREVSAAGDSDGVAKAKPVLCQFTASLEKDADGHKQGSSRIPGGRKVAK